MPQNPRLYQSGYTGLTGADLANYLRREYSPEELDQAQMLIKSVELDIASECRRPFEYRGSFSERFNLPAHTIYTHAFPILEVEKFMIGEEEVDVDYTIEGSSILFPTGVFGFERINKGLEVIYTIPQFWGDDVKNLVLKLAGQAMLNAEDGGVTKKEFSFVATRMVMDYDKFEKERRAIISKYKTILV